MAILYNKQTEKNEVVQDRNLIDALKSGDYIPVPKAKYHIEDTISGEEQELDGDSLLKTLREDSVGVYAPVDTTFKKAKEHVKSKGVAGQLGFIGKNLLDETLTLGTSEIVAREMMTPYQKIIADAENEVYGTSKTVSNLASWVVPAIMSGGVSTLAKGVAKDAAKVIAKKGLGSLPTAQLIKGSHSFGKMTGEAAKKLALKLGLGKSGANILGSVGYGVGASAVDATVIGAAHGAAKGLTKDKETDEVSFSSKLALSEGAEVGKEIFKYSTIFLGTGYLGIQAGKGVGRAAKGVGSRLSSISKSIMPEGHKVIGDFLRKSFFNSKAKFSAEQDIKKMILNSARYFKNKLSDESLAGFYDRLPDAVKTKIFKGKTPDIKTIRKNFYNLVKESKASDAFYLFGEEIKRLNGGKFPVDKESTTRLINKLKEIYGKRLGELRSKVNTEQANKVYDAPKVIKSKLGTSQVYDKKVTSNLDKKTKSLYSKIQNLPKKAKENLKRNIEFLHLAPDLKLKVNLKNPSSVDTKAFQSDLSAYVIGVGIKKLKFKNFKDFSSPKGQKQLKEFIQNDLNVPKENINTIMKYIDSDVLSLNRTHFQTVFDLSRGRQILKKRKMTLSEIDELEGIVKTYGDDVGGGSWKDEFLDKELFVTSKPILNKVNSLLSDIGELSKEINPNIVQGIERVKAILKDRDKLSIFELNEIRHMIEEYAQFKKIGEVTVQNVKARKLYGILSEAENELFEQLSKSKKFKDNGKGLFESKKAYSFLSDLAPYIDSFENAGFFKYYGRDIMLGILGFYAGGVPFAAAMYGISKGSAKGFGFLKAASFADRLSKGIQTSYNKLSVFSSLPKLEKVLKATKVVGSKSSLITMGRASGILFGSNDKKTLEDIDMALDEMLNDPDEMAKKGTEYYAEASKAGGAQFADEFKTSTLQFFYNVKAIMPKGYRDAITMMKKFTVNEENSFRSNMTLIANPSLFIDKVKSGSLSDVDINIMKQFYPNLIAKFVSNLVTLVQSGKVKLDSRLRNSFNALMGKDVSSFLYRLDLRKQADEEQERQRLRAGGVKFSSLSQPTGTDRQQGL